MPDFTLRSLRGGVNNSDPALGLSDDQAVTMLNVELLRSMLGERRRGTSAITLPASISGKDRTSFMFRYVPDADDTAAELWVFAFSAASSQLARKTTSWSDVSFSPADTVNLSGFSPYQWAAAYIHGKLFLALDTDVDRLHVVDGAAATTVRRAGVATPAAPTAANQTAGPPNVANTVRYYRVRYTVQSGGVTLRRSEPSAVLSFTPSGAHQFVRVTKPASISESETHWELELGASEDGNFYVIATTAVGTTTFDDNAVLTTLDTLFDLAPDVGDYSNIWSARYLITDEDRLMFGGSWEDSTKSSLVGWTPVGNADGVGNDERYELDTDPLVNLDGRDGGPLTGLAQASAGEIFAFKFQRIFKLVRTSLRQRAYDTICIDKTRGALHGSVVNGIDQNGKPCVYALDPAVGPIRAGAGGVKQCGADIRTTWESLNLEASKVVCCGLYYPATRQVVWNISTSGSNTPNLSIVLQTNETRDAQEGGIRRGWTIWNGTRTQGLCMVLFSDNIETGAARSRTLVPFIGGEFTGRVHRCDTGTDDNGTAYAAQIRTKPYLLRSMMQKFEVLAGIISAKAVTGAKITMQVIRDFGKESTSTVTPVEFDVSLGGSETDVIKFLDDLTGAEMSVAQFDLADTSPAGTGRWELNYLCLAENDGQRLAGDR